MQGTLLHRCFLFFVIITSSTSVSMQDPMYEGDVLYQSPEYAKQRSRFMFVLFLLIYFQNRLKGFIFEPFWFILHFRGLTNTGFSAVHHLGLCPSVRTLPALIARVIKKSQSQTFSGCVWWCDNLRRLICGFFPSSERQDWTVTGRTLLPDPIPDFDPIHPAFGNIFTQELVELCSELMLNAENVQVFDSNTYFDNSECFSVPIRSKHQNKYQFCETDVLPSACGTIAGSITLMRYLSKESLQHSNKYSICVLDYDLYWRIMKFYHTSSLWRPFELQQDRLILIMGPWHIYKVLTEAVWKAFSALILAPMWLHAKAAKVPAIPSVVEITTIFVAIAMTSKSQPRWCTHQNDPICLSIQLLMYHFIPLVGRCHANGIVITRIGFQHRSFDKK